MLGQSTLKTSAEEIENKLDRLGSSVSINSGDEDLSISIQTQKKNLNATLKIIKESMFEPKFDQTEFELEKRNNLMAFLKVKLMHQLLQIWHIKNYFMVKIMLWDILLMEMLKLSHLLP